LRKAKTPKASSKKVIFSVKQGGQARRLVKYRRWTLKNIIADGMETITANFEQMEKSLVNMIIGNKPQCIENLFLMIDRKSF
jgi:hypothetical protein